ncbi:MAG: polysaccharide deacetylase family protein [Desulfitobacteriaceae bacterium]|nr:polysaccharide deacetylase family protein [Desulfitobacteriaceae bacterium]MDI6879030.1 polysaccharide deacetylase family protein [Desulfitobacteriaceae bacterium]MDI6914768.1 polysaccharide deacetylase family protein [Desulfitobacteriaceae bacterium]
MMHWVNNFMVLIVLGVVMYTVIPDLFLHRLGIGSWKRQYGPGVAITFDDGPDPNFTPRVLDILDYYKVSATFFVVGEKAKRYPDLVQQILARGHIVGAHSQNHRLSWKMSPLATWQEWQENIKTLESITGKEIQWIRPPWGTFNLALWLWMKKYQKKAVLWSIKGNDWQVKCTPAEITSRILKNIKQGSILLLHDSGGESGAPENSVQALNIICRRIIDECKLPIAPLEFPQWTWWRRWAFVLWEKWEYLYANYFQIKRIDATSLFRLTKKRYQGPELYDGDGTLLAKKGDMVADIHLDSIRLQSKESDLQRIGLRALSLVRKSLPVLAKFTAESPEYQNVKVLVGLTLLNRGVKGLGFEVQEVPSSWPIRRIGIVQKVIMVVYHPLGKSRNNKRLGNKPKLVWISKQKLLDLWLPQNEDTAIEAIPLEIGAQVQ